MTYFRKKVMLVEERVYLDGIFCKSIKSVWLIVQFNSDSSSLILRATEISHIIYLFLFVVFVL